MLAFHLMHYRVIMDPVYALDFLNEMWAKEPAGMLSICITVSGLLLTLGFKLLDWLWEWRKDVARQGKLRIELEVDVDLQGQLVLWSIVSNIGREPIVLRDIGYVQARWLGREFHPVEPSDRLLPRALNARDMVRIPIADELDALETLIETFHVKDSMGKLWEAPEREVRRARRRLKAIHTERGRQAQVTANRQFLLEKLEASPPLTTQN